MTLFSSLVAHTSNVLGSFNDPFEFDGDYGSEVSSVRQKVFELVVAKEALFKNLNDLQVSQLVENDDISEKEIKNYKRHLLTQAIEEDRSHGPILSELVTSDLITALAQKQQELQSAGFSTNDLEEIKVFLNKNAEKKIFRLFRNIPSELLSLDKILGDKVSREGKNFNLPILSSTQILKGCNFSKLKKELLQVLFNSENLSIAKPREFLDKSLSQLNENFLKQFLGENSKNEELKAFFSPAGQIFFYWLYQALNLQLVAKDQKMIDQINKVKEVFVQTVGDPVVRAKKFKEKLIAADSGIVFTQESDTFVPQTLVQEGLFLPIDKQNSQDGTFIFLRSDLWESDYEIISLEEYEGFKKGRINLILAKSKVIGEKFLFASAHGNSTRSEDGRLQISFAVKKFEELSQLPENKGLQLVIGTDANTKTEEDVRLFKEHLDSLGLIGTNVGPTTIKRRMVTAQHEKAGKFAIDQEDYLITLKPEKGGKFILSQPTIGFSMEKPDVTLALPNIDNMSDHYPVGATLKLVPGLTLV